MKKIIVGLVLILALGLVGCSQKEVDVKVEEYNIKDLECTKDVPKELENKEDIIEIIVVSSNLNDISESMVKQILEKLENKNIKTEIIIENIQGNEIAKITEFDKKTIVDIKPGYKSNDKGEIVIENTDELKTLVENQRIKVENVLYEGINDTMKDYKGLSESISDNLLTDKYIKDLAKLFEDKDPKDISQIKIKGKDFMESTRLKEPMKIFLLASDNYEKMHDYAKQYKNSKSDTDLKDFKSAVLAFRGNVATYIVRINSLDGSDSSLNDKINNY
ncbi:hypothetical protein LZ906_017855 (plasmid) [Paraclostridium ghonii]|uniref:hypothetical protein n=1 Tax=Paraclostridium ghonii TaxID=29358 RepID=UPI00202D0012|nr:hypothetical protein [Paeniclostridium ghonii]MCM0167411.1 hypothetical protein [Paeniclostridium ghonii]